MSNDGWISVDERLPEEGDKVLMLEEYSGAPKVFAGLIDVNNRWRYALSYNYINNTITHWCPLPDDSPVKVGTEFKRAIVEPRKHDPGKGNVRWNGRPIGSDGAFSSILPLSEAKLLARQLNYAYECRQGDYCPDGKCITHRFCREDVKKAESRAREIEEEARQQLRNIESDLYGIYNLCAAKESALTEINILIRRVREMVEQEERESKPSQEAPADIVGGKP